MPAAGTRVFHLPQQMNTIQDFLSSPILPQFLPTTQQNPCYPNVPFGQSFLPIGATTLFLPPPLDTASTAVAQQPSAPSDSADASDSAAELSPGTQAAHIMLQLQAHQQPAQDPAETTIISLHPESIFASTQSTASSEHAELEAIITATNSPLPPHSSSSPSSRPSPDPNSAAAQSEEQFSSVRNTPTEMPSDSNTQLSSDANVIMATEGTMPPMDHSAGEQQHAVAQPGLEAPNVQPVQRDIANAPSEQSVHGVLSSSAPNCCP